MKLGLKVAVLLAGGSPSTLDEGSFQPRRPFAHSSRPALAGAFVVPGTEAAPGDQMSLGREPCHVDADLGDDNRGAELVDAGDGAQDFDRRSKGLDLAVDLLIDLSDGRVNRVDMLEQKTQHKAMMVGDPTAQGCLEFGRG